MDCGVASPGRRHTFQHAHTQSQTFIIIYGAEHRGSVVSSRQAGLGCRNCHPRHRPPLVSYTPSQSSRSNVALGCRSPVRCVPYGCHATQSHSQLLVCVETSLTQHEYGCRPRTSAHHPMLLVHTLVYHHPRRHSFPRRSAVDSTSRLCSGFHDGERLSRLRIQHWLCDSRG